MALSLFPPSLSRARCGSPVVLTALLFRHVVVQRTCLPTSMDSVRQACECCDCGGKRECCDCFRLPCGGCASTMKAGRLSGRVLSLSCARVWLRLSPFCDRGW